MTGAGPLWSVQVLSNKVELDPISWVIFGIFALHAVLDMGVWLGKRVRYAAVTTLTSLGT